MPFEVLKTLSKGRVVDAAPVRAALYVKKERGSVIELVFDPETLIRVGWVAGKSRIFVAEGSGPDTGIIQLQLSTQPGKGIALTNRSTAVEDAALRIVCASFSHHKFSDQQIGLHPVTHQIFGSTITAMIETLLS